MKVERMSMEDYVSSLEKSRGYIARLIRASVHDPVVMTMDTPRKAHSRRNYACCVRRRGLCQLKIVGRDNWIAIGPGVYVYHPRKRTPPAPPALPDFAGQACTEEPRC